MKTELEQQVEKILKRELSDNLKIEATKNYDGWNGTVVEIKILYEGDVVAQTKFNVL